MTWFSQGTAVPVLTDLPETISNDEHVLALPLMAINTNGSAVICVIPASLFQQIKVSSSYKYF